MSINLQQPPTTIEKIYSIIKGLYIASIPLSVGTFLFIPNLYSEVLLMAIPLCAAISATVKDTSFERLMKIINFVGLNINKATNNYRDNS